MSPSSSVTGRPVRSVNAARSARAIVDLPEPDKPVRNTEKPCASRGGAARRNASTSALVSTQSGTSGSMPTISAGVGDRITGCSRGRYTIESGVLRRRRSSRA